MLLIPISKAFNSHINCTGFRYNTQHFRWYHYIPCYACHCRFGSLNGHGNFHSHHCRCRTEHTRENRDWRCHWFVSDRHHWLPAVLLGTWCRHMLRCAFPESAGSFSAMLTNILLSSCKPYSFLSPFRFLFSVMPWRGLVLFQSQHPHEKQLDSWCTCAWRK